MIRSATEARRRSGDGAWHWFDRPYGVPAEAARRTLQFGQRDFDALDADTGLTPDQQATLYAYFFMRRHYCEMRHALRCHPCLELVAGRTLAVYDVGCGPATAGLAFAGHLASSAGVATDTRTWFAMKGSVGSATFSGIPGQIGRAHV